VNLLGASEVARILGISIPRVYQLEPDLDPVVEQHGRRRKLRYRPDVVERVRAARVTGEHAMPSAGHGGSLAWTRLREFATRHGKPLDITEIEVDAVSRRPCVLCGTPANVVHDLAALDPEQPWTASNLAPFCVTCQRMLATTGSRNAGDIIVQVFAIVRHQIEAISGDRIHDVLTTVSTFVERAQREEYTDLGERVLALLTPLAPANSSGSG
jgi:hypothetical protein